MNKILLGTTALVAAGAMAGTAAAAEPVKMGVGGYFAAHFVMASQDDGSGVDLISGTADDEPGANLRSHKLTREGEIIFNGSTTLDNGIQVGVQVQLEAETCGDQIDESFIWFSGSFGRFQIGSENSAAYTMMYGPGGTAPHTGLMSANFRHYATGGNSAGVPTFRINITSDSEKLTYFTPRMSGFQLGISYTPDNCEENGGGVSACGGTYAGFQNDHSSGQQSENVEVGANYQGKLGTVDIGLSAAWSGSNVEKAAGGGSVVNTEDRDAWGIGGTLGIGNIGLSAAYMQDDMGDARNNGEYTHWGMGLKYGMGPWTMGLEYSNVEAEDAVTGSGTDDLSGFEVGATYAFGPGISMGAAIQFVSLDDSRPGTTGNNQANDATVFILATAIGF